MKDFLGKELKFGDTIVIATRVGNSAEMKLRQVVSTDIDKYGRNFIKVLNPMTGRTASVDANNIAKVEFDE